MLHYISIRQRDLVILLFTFIVIVKSKVPRPRGVSLSNASLYVPTKSNEFVCFDGLITIPFRYVNDDYCDCSDGSDEPGTSACTNSKFHCNSIDVEPFNIPSSRVNDGICDCCDGSDEYLHRDKCRDECKEVREKLREEARQLSERHKQGSIIKQEIIIKGRKKHSIMAEELAQLEKDKEEAEKVRNEKEMLKNEWEQRENEALKIFREAEEELKKRQEEQQRIMLEKEAKEYFAKLDQNNDNDLSFDELKVFTELDKDGDGEIDDEDFKNLFPDNESIDEEKFVASWHLIKSSLTKEEAIPTQEIEQQESEIHEEQHYEEENEGDDGNIEEHDNHEDEDAAGDEPEHDETPQDEDKTSKYDEDTQNIINKASEARQSYNEADRAVHEIESNIKNIQQNLDKDYGLQHEFAALESECYEYTDKEYTYTLCMFQKVTQKAKSSGSEVSLGTWGEWVGDGQNKYSVMKYTNGMSCWNGPSRSAVVNLHCGLETRILSVTEPSRCEYKFEMSTPVVCDEAFANQQMSHDEL